MGKRMGWDNLKASTRERYEKRGMTRQAYESGASLKYARSHHKTPEHPSQRITREAFPEYFSKRLRLENELQRRKEEIFGDRPKWDSQKSWVNIRAKPPTIEQLKWAINASAEELEDALRDDRDTYRFVGYH